MSQNKASHFGSLLIKILMQSFMLGHKNGLQNLIMEMEVQFMLCITNTASTIKSFKGTVPENNKAIIIITELDLQV